MKKADWLIIKNEYINGNISYRNLAEKHGVSFNTLKSRAASESWVEKREQQHYKIATKTGQKTADTIASHEAERIAKVRSLTDTLIDKLEQASAQLDNYLVTNRVKVKKVVYDSKVKGKPKKETTTETESIAVAEGMIDRQGLKLLAGALKDINDIITKSTAEPSDQTADNSLLTALNKSTQEVWKDVSEIQPETDAGDDLVEPPADKRSI